MTYGVSEYNKLKFLEQYDIMVENHSNGKYTEICMIAEGICVTYHEWPQFNDQLVIVSKNIEERKEHRGKSYTPKWFYEQIVHEEEEDIPNLTWSVVDHVRYLRNKKQHAFIDLVVEYIRQSIEKDGTLFEIPVVKQN